MSNINSRAEWQCEQNRAMMRIQQSIDTRVAEGNDIEHRSDQRRLMRRIALEQRDAAMEDNITKLKEAEFFRAQTIERDANIARELQRVNDESLLEKKKRQQLRENCDELKTLEARLRALYCMKELDSQLAEKKLAEIQQKNQEARIKEHVVGSMQKQKEEEERLEFEEMMRKKLYGDELKAQMVNETNKKELEFQEVLRERRLLDEAVQRVDEEDQKAEIERIEKVEKTKKDIEDFKTAQMIWSKRQRNELEDEHNRIADYLENQDNDEQKRMEARRHREEIQAKLRENVARQIYETERKKEEREGILQAVAEEELLAEQERKRREEIDKKIRFQVEAQESYRQQEAERNQCMLREANEEKAYRQQLMDKIAKDAYEDRMAEEKQRLKMIQFNRDVKDAMEAKRVQRAEELQREICLDRLLEDEEKNRLRMIEEERLRMMKEHAPNLVGYMRFDELR